MRSTLLMFVVEATYGAAAPVAGERLCIVQAISDQRPQIRSIYADTANWRWQDQWGRLRTRGELTRVLKQHEIWLSTGGSLGVRANFAHATLRAAKLTGAQLRGAILDSANLDHAILDRADLTGTSLVGTKLDDAKLRYAHLEGADLSGASLIGDSMVGAFLNRAGLCEADLRDADLYGANLSYAVLTGARLWSADLRDAILVDTRLSGSSPAGQMSARCASPTPAELFHARLGGIENAFEPVDLGNIRSLASASGLPELRYDSDPGALVQLKKAFQEGGFRRQERDITYALLRAQTAELLTGSNPDSSNIVGRASMRLQGGLRILLLDYPAKYGRAVNRPLVLILLLWVGATLLYFVTSHLSGAGGLFLVYGKVSSPPMHVEASGRVPTLRRRLDLEGRVFAYCALFSLMTTFNYGFRELDFGKWIRNIFPVEFDLQAKGLTRTVAGLQALVSLYLFALWVLNYFGRPFDSLM